LRLVLLKLDYKQYIIIVTCNTASSCLNEFKSKINIKVPILGIIHFGIYDFLDLNKEDKKCAVICTSLTKKNNSYNNYLSLKLGINFNKFIHISYSKFVTYIENGIFYDDELLDLAEYYFKDIKNNFNIKFIIYGCTHYPLISKVCEEIIYNKFNRHDIKFIDPSDYLLKKITQKISNISNKGTSTFYYSKNDNNFIKNARFILNEKISINYISL